MMGKALLGSLEGMEGMELGLQGVASQLVVSDQLKQVDLGIQ